MVHFAKNSNFAKCRKSVAKMIHQKKHRGHRTSKSKDAQKQLARTSLNKTDRKESWKKTNLLCETKFTGKP